MVHGVQRGAVHQRLLLYLNLEKPERKEDGYLFWFWATSSCAWHLKNETSSRLEHKQEVKRSKKTLITAELLACLHHSHS